MRLLYTFDNEKHGVAFHTLLKQNDIDNQLEVRSETDWGSTEYGDYQCHIWIYEEDLFEPAQQWLNQFLKNPDDPKYYEHKKTQVPIKPPPFTKEKVAVAQSIQSVPRAQPTGVVTLYLILACTMLFLFGLGPLRSFKSPPPNLPLTPLFSSPLKKTLMFDYPQAYVIIDKLINAYGIDQLYTPDELPAEGKILLAKSIRTPYWNGIYDKIVAYLKTPSTPITIKAPLFEKQRQGEVWRLFTPALLHNDLFHLFFNMIWLLVLGKQIENHIGILKYLLFILVAGVFSNVSQYLMSGANFIGFSGVLCAMIMFVWVRQKKAPWEGYQLLPVTMGFISIFILAMVGLQGISFILEIYGRAPISPPIANTAHLSGALCGYLFGKSNIFSWKS